MHNFIETGYTKYISDKSIKDRDLTKKEKSIIEKEVNDLLHSFKCIINKDVEKYLHQDAIRHHKSSISRTYLIITTIDEKIKIIAYFTLSMKSFYIQSKNSIIENISNNFYKKMNSKNNFCSTFLIGQLGKNDEFSNFINLAEILEFAYGIINEVRELIGGRLVLIECENKEKLINHYKKHGFEFIQSENELMQLMKLKDN